MTLKEKLVLSCRMLPCLIELTVYDNVDYFCGLYIRDKGLRKQYVEDAIAFVGP